MTQSQTVTQLTNAIKMALESGFDAVSVEGEVSQPTYAQSGHVYFTLKDEGAALSCVMWRSTAERLRIRLQHGQQIAVGGSIQVYAPQGRYQLIVSRVQMAGEGALQRAFLQLKLKLEQEGLFDPARKRPLPRFPHTVGVITSATGAAFHDIRDTIERRWPLVHVRLFHASVQGATAAGELVSGLRYFAENPPDVVIISRGGGSLEDLWPFNEEAVARAIHAMPVPVVSAVGHETDFSISDFVADVRAATPTQSALLVTPDRDEMRLRVDEQWMKTLRTVKMRLVRTGDLLLRLRSRTGRRALLEGLDRRTERIHLLMRRCTDRLRGRLDRVGDRLPLFQERMKRTLANRTARLEDRIPTLRERIQRAADSRLGAAAHRLELLRSRHEALDPDRPLDKGFARVMQDGLWVRRKHMLKDGEFEIVWRDGRRKIK